MKIQGIKFDSEDWLHICKLARSSGQFPTAFNALQHQQFSAAQYRILLNVDLKYSTHNALSYFREMAKLEWQQGRQMVAISILSKVLSESPAVQAVSDACPSEVSTIFMEK